ncbi:MAG: HpcH/HpaI aldolase family protein, partial [Vicinamibacteraceae bacterium]
SCRYPPQGIRGYGPRRASSYGFDADEYYRLANESLLCIAIIESYEAVDNIDDILSVEGIDGVTIGPMDLSISLGIFRQLTHTKYLSAVERVRTACAKHRKAMGSACQSVEHARQCVEEGYQLLLVYGDDQFIASEAARWLGAIKEKGRLSA